MLGIDDGVAKSVEVKKAGKRASERRSALDGTTSSDSIDSERVEAAQLAADRVSTYAAWQGHDRTTYLGCLCHPTSIQTLVMKSLQAKAFDTKDPSSQQAFLGVLRENM